MTTHSAPILRVAVGLLGTCILAPVKAIEPDRLFELISPSVFLIATFDKNNKKLSTGSGVVVGPGQIITNCHVLAKSSKVLLIRHQESFEATLEYPDPERDLCQLKVPDLRAPAVRIGKASALRVGQRVYAVGAPRGLELSLSDGLVSSLRDTKQGAPQIQTTAPISPGSSGGGLFDANGTLVGITTWLVRESQNLNFAFPAEWIAQVPERGRVNLAKMEERYKERSGAGGTTATGAPLPPFDPDLPANMPQAGDSWTYAHVDLKFKPLDRNRQYQHTVISSKAGMISESISTPGGAPILKTEYMPSITAYARMGIIEISPFMLSFDEPHVGKTWRGIRIQEGEQTSTGLGSVLSLFSGRVVGEETITVPAGQFASMKVRYEGDIARNVFGHTSVPQIREPISITIWYAKAVKRPARILMESASLTDAYELESFKIR